MNQLCIPWVRPEHTRLDPGLNPGHGNIISYFQISTFKNKLNMKKLIIIKELNQGTYKSHSIFHFTISFWHEISQSHTRMSTGMKKG